MDMTSADSDATTVMMTPYLHFTGGDILFFKSLQPTSHGAIAGACIVLVILSIFERMLSAARGVMQAHWRRSALALVSARSSELIDDTTDDGEKKDADVEIEEPVLETRATPEGRPASRRARIIAPFIVSHDITRGALYSLQALLAYALMLAVMTFQAAYVISIVLGLGLGEALFGRFGTGSSQLH